MIQALGTILLMLLAVLGMGGVGLRLAGLWNVLVDRDKLAFGLPLGLGLLGWLMFFVGAGGFLAPAYLAGVLIVCALGAVLWRETWPPKFPMPDGFSGLVGLGCVVLVVVLNVVNALPPPTDADSMAYHFALPKQFLADGAITFVPRAVSGAIPLLVQSTYLPALGLGGELGLTLWVMVTGLMAGLVFYLFARRYLNEVWSLALTLVLVTVPAFVYGAGAGQAEVRNMIFVMAAAFAVADGLRTGNGRFIFLAGAMAGFFAAAKYSGLLFVAVAGLGVLRNSRWLAFGTLFGAGVILSGTQWYLWNWWHTGDPVFPMLFGVLNLPDTEIWTAAYNTYFRSVFPGDAEVAVPNSVFWFIAYPFKATFFPAPIFESARTGFGVVGMAVLPLAMGGAWMARKDMLRHPLFTVGQIALIFYALWFFAGSSQRIRHLLPVYPLVILCLGVAAHRYAAKIGALRPLAFGLIAVIVIQIGGLVVFSKNALQYVYRGETRDAYLERVLKDYDAARWINEHLRQTDRVALLHRTLLYHLEVPYFYSHHQLQALVDVGPQSRDPDRFLKQLKEQGVTHVLFYYYPDLSGISGGLSWLSQKLVERGAARVVGKITGKAIASRTLAGLTPPQKSEIWIIEINK